jgi:hypothetical protein
VLRIARADLAWSLVVLTSALLNRAVFAQAGKEIPAKQGPKVTEVYRAKLYGKGETLFEGDYASVNEFIKRWNTAQSARDLRLLMLKGPYKLVSADMAKVEEWKGTPVDDGHGRNKGECVSLVRAATGLPDTGKWRAGAKVVGNAALTRGTPIATFDEDGKYPKSDKHAAIFDHVDAKGTIWVWHQYTKGTRPYVHLAPLTSGGKGTERYYVIEVPPAL